MGDNEAESVMAECPFQPCRPRTVQPREKSPLAGFRPVALLGAPGTAHALWEGSWRPCIAFLPRFLVVFRSNVILEPRRGLGGDCFYYSWFIHFCVLLFFCQ